ncbi:DUF3796 domain-containing protein [Pseudalkalibacillus caeni]|uniref:DUF3796 domain-containing protein n=1 Tax=Exobacillus caeni TaxID=2574798 RepID=UPI001485535D
MKSSWLKYLGFIGFIGLLGIYPLNLPMLGFFGFFAFFKFANVVHDERFDHNVNRASRNAFIAFCATGSRKGCCRRQHPFTLFLDRDDTEV